MYIRTFYWIHLFDINRGKVKSSSSIILNVKKEMLNILPFRSFMIGLEKEKNLIAVQIICHCSFAFQLLNFGGSSAG